MIPNGEWRDSKRSRGGGEDLPGAPAAVDGGGGDDDSRQGRTQTGKGRRAQRRQHARADADGQGTKGATTTACKSGR
jgi:hypothetical protein